MCLEGVRSAETGRELTRARLDQQDRIEWYVMHPGIGMLMFCVLYHSPIEKSLLGFVARLPT